LDIASGLKKTARSPGSAFVPNAESQEQDPRAKKKFATKHGTAGHQSW
jgi:hypothetical protein